jgi:hypothetical protein
MFLPKQLMPMVKLTNKNLAHVNKIHVAMQELLYFFGLVVVSSLTSFKGPWDNLWGNTVLSVISSICRHTTSSPPACHQTASKTFGPQFGGCISHQNYLQT